MTRLDILAISGSLRTGSYNAAMVRAAQEHAPDDIDVTIYDALRDIPPYDQDLDTDERTPEHLPVEAHRAIEVRDRDARVTERSRSHKSCC